MSISENPTGESPAELASESSRENWELMERVAELEAKLAEREERDRIRELEISALRHELELRFAYNTSLERALEEQRNLNGITHLLETERSRAEIERSRADGAEHLLAAERARISYRLVNWVAVSVRQLTRGLR
jgi:hypothetical protein